MKKDIITVMMNPIRIRIIQELAIRGEATTKDIQQACGECAQATLYRHLKEMLQYDLIQVVAENNINGIMEKVYAIKRNLTKEIQDDPSKLTKEDLSFMFSQFLISLLTDYSTYLSHDNDIHQILADVSFASATMFLTDEELKNVKMEFGQIFKKYFSNKPGSGRKLRKISNIISTNLETK